ncbi:hypothetical protein GCM10010435_39840 [Winogradskya consettensis]|uniref:Uncharacterized protein n=1 Tax=Winogradskya consettensis TaxID=113560 RepID=A0A919SBJ6_9ACTN|nr:hypothetical protein [Actinoplanes consettensis]GIM69585.1 hypothetical protein Aco04nite_15970 [Actinoplanes consettensis]
MRAIREADWNSRRTLQVGTAGEIPVHWCIEDGTVTALIGPDHETWHIAFLMPVATVDRLVTEAADFS